MGRVTIKELQEKLQRNNDIIKWQQDKIQELQEQNEKILDNKGAVSKEENKALIKQFESLQENYKQLKKNYEHEKERNNTLINKYTELENQLAKLQEKEPKHNERGAGRKSSLTDEQIQNVKELHQQGLSYGAIAKKVNLSKPYVYKLINAQNEIIV